MKKEKKVNTEDNTLKDQIRIIEKEDHLRYKQWPGTALEKIIIKDNMQEQQTCWIKTRVAMDKINPSLSMTTQETL